MSFYLAIVSPLDIPLYETQFQSSSSSQSSSTSTTSTSFPSWSSFTTSSGADLNAETGNMFTPQPQATQAQGGGIERHLAQMVAFASLDSVDELLEGTGNLYLKNVDRHNQWTASAFIATSVKFVLLHDQKNDDGIRTFFLDLWELYVKASLNPFHTVNTPIRSPAFDARQGDSSRAWGAVVHEEIPESRWWARDASSHLQKLPEGFSRQ